MKKWRKREFCHAVECRTGTGRQKKLPRRVGIETAENGGKFKSWESACPGTCKTGNKSKIDFHTSTQLTWKTRCIYLQSWLLGGPSPHSQLVPHPFNWSPNTVFYRYLCIGRSNQPTLNVNKKCGNWILCGAAQIRWNCRASFLH